MALHKVNIGCLASPSAEGVFYSYPKEPFPPYRRGDDQ